MNDQKTRKVGSSATVDKTRLVRRSEDDESMNGPAKANKGTGFPKTKLVARNVKANSPPDAATPAENQDDAERKVTGWLVVTVGPGKGNFAALFDGMNSVGRGDDQSTQIDFGDDKISRSEHAFVTYDYQSRKFYITHGGKANVVRLNDQPVLQPIEIKTGDKINLGETTLQFVAFCGPVFDW